ncbi:MAG: FeoB small GTPase domain-containing protein [Verrucomicrobiales bacterium]
MKTEPAAQASPCEGCPSHHAGNLVRMGIKMDNYDYVVALAGNPNTGKSTVFNALTGLRQHTGNWPGKTVTRAEGGFQYGDKRYKIVDLPGTYSLLSTSTDEEVARNFILFGRPDVTVIVVDASRLERNLNLALQVLEITNRAVLCLNLVDEAARHGVSVDERLLAKELGIPVVATAARKGEGMPDLLKAISEVATARVVCKPLRVRNQSPKLNRALDELTGEIESRFSAVPNPRWVAMRIMEGDQRIIEALRDGELKDIERADQRENAMAAM